ncbi:MAG: YdhR family protein [Nevskia sp.]|nr:YdhR family protein [Nevskia sp.]
MPVILQVNFTPGPGHRAQTRAERLDSARRIAAFPGLRWKAWIGNEATDTAGGIYLFDDDARASAWEEQLRQRLSAAGATDVLIRHFEVDEQASAITRAPLEAALQPA